MIACGDRQKNRVDRARYSATGGKAFTLPGPSPPLKIDDWHDFIIEISGLMSNLAGNATVRTLHSVNLKTIASRYMYPSGR